MQLVSKNDKNKRPIFQEVLFVLEKIKKQFEYESARELGVPNVSVRTLRNVVPILKSNFSIQLSYRFSNKNSDQKIAKLHQNHTLCERLQTFYMKKSLRQVVNERTIRSALLNIGKKQSTK